MPETSREISPMICPHCGHTMNHHADKMLQLSSWENGGESTILELHSCPECGTNASRGQA
jgi:predicted RNA-binding Zn-ribbon protein involved in translation (DUF1610 family)